MKKITVLFFLCFISLSNSQTTLKQLNSIIRKSSSSQNVELRNINELNQIQVVKNLKVQGFKIPTNIKKPTIAKYDNEIKNLPKIANKNYKEMYPNLSVKDARVIPEYYFNYSKNSTGGTKPLIFTPVIANSKPLVNDNEKGYKTKIQLMLHSDNPKNDDNDDISVKLEVLSEKLIVKNGKITLSHLKLPTTDVELYTEKKNVKDSVEIRIITDSNPIEGYRFFLKVKPSLSLETNQKKIQGFGVQKGKVIVRFNGSSSTTKENIIIKSSAGEVNPSSFTLAYNEAKVINVRSEGLDDIKLTASTSSTEQVITDSNTIIIKQTFPYLFLIASLLGGVLGMVIKFGYKKSKENTPKLFLAGVLIGFLGAVIYYVLGINLLKIEVSSTFNEFAVLGFSALCSLMLKPDILVKA